MKKALTALLFSLLIIAIIPVNIFAFDNYTIPKTTTAPAIDGKADSCYMKLNSFYDTAEYLTNYDANQDGKGSVYLCYDDTNLYVYIEAIHDTYSPLNDPYVSSNGSCMYLAILAGLPDAFNENSQIQLAINLSEDGTQEWKFTGSVPADTKDNSVDKIYSDTAPFQYITVRDEKVTTTYYEVALPWKVLDRTGTIDFTEGHVFTFDFIVTENPGTIVQYGQGLMNDIYDGGSYITLGAAPVVETAAPETVAEAAVVDTTTTAVQTGTADMQIAAICIAAALAGLVLVKKKSEK
jgi:Domain of unknown function (DUF1083).